MITQVFAVALNTFREAIRNHILYSVVLFAVLIIGVSALFGAVSIGDQLKVIKDFGLFSISFFGVIITIICGVSLLSKEIKQKTILNILSKPIDRSAFIVGKQLGLMMTSGTLVGLMGVGLFVFVWLVSGETDYLLFQGIFFALLEVIVIAAVTLFFSSIVVTTTLTGLFTISTFVVGRSIAYFAYFFEEGALYNPVLAALLSIFSVILPDLSKFNVADALVYGHPVGFGYAVGALLYCLGYSGAILTLATIIFKHREMT